ncbi:MAG TPA: succinate dehydrogenase, hydrophobic membrane anchor protein [Devosia sp.]|nr:succinate dehydrogenase, hydrophobic membrane anchor protein [Devosia sp.]
MADHDTSTPLARAAGLGSAHRGTEHWWTQRVTGVALIPLTLWLVGSIVVHARSGHGDLVAWLAAPFSMIAMPLLLIALFYHAALGLQVVIEDYVHSGLKFVAIVAVRLGSLILLCAGIVALLHIAFSN